MALRVLSYHPSHIAIDGEILSIRVARLGPLQSTSFNEKFRRIGAGGDLTSKDAALEEAEAKAFISDSIGQYVTVDDGELFADGMPITLGEDLVRLFGAREEVLSELLMTIFLENTLNADQKVERRRSLAPFVPTPEDVARRMMELAGVHEGDRFIDLGCGDGALCIAAAKAGATAVGYDSSSERIAAARIAADAAGVRDMCLFEEREAMDAPVGDATVIGLYLLPSTTLRVRDKLAREAAKGARVVSHAFPISGWIPTGFAFVPAPDGTTLHNGQRQIYSYLVS